MKTSSQKSEVREYSPLGILRGVFSGGIPAGKTARAFQAENVGRRKSPDPAGSGVSPLTVPF